MTNYDFDIGVKGGGAGNLIATAGVEKKKNWQVAEEEWTFWRCQFQFRS